jgi:hypothetical protein
MTLIHTLASPLHILMEAIRRLWKKHIIDDGWEDTAGFHRGYTHEGDKS